MSFRDRLIAAEAMNGTFVKNTEPHSIEILGHSGFDFVLLDSEHAPFDRHSLDMALLATRAARLHGIVRVRDDSQSEILNALDLGADGIVVPHVRSVEQAKRIVAAARHSGTRGYSNSPRAGAYGSTDTWAHVDAADQLVAVIAMIEDAEAVERVHEILAVDGLDAIMLGRNDLAVSMQDREEGAPEVSRLADRVVSAASAAGKQALLFVADGNEARDYRMRGVMTAIISSDQSLLRRAAVAEIRLASGA